MPIQHGTITGDAVHVPYAGTFANAAARTGATGLDSTQHGKLFRQLDDNSLWMLASTSPLTWKSLSPDRVASAGYADNAGYANNAGNAGALNGKTEGSLSVNYANSAGSVGMAGNTNLITGAIRRGRTEWVASSVHRVVGPKGGQFAVFYPISLWYFNTTIQPGVYEGGHVFGSFSRDNFPDEDFGVFFQVG